MYFFDEKQTQEIFSDIDFLIFFFAASPKPHRNCKKHAPTRRNPAKFASR